MKSIRLIRRHALSVSVLVAMGLLVPSTAMAADGFGGEDCSEQQSVVQTAQTPTGSDVYTGPILPLDDLGKSKMLELARIKAVEDGTSILSAVTSLKNHMNVTGTTGSTAWSYKDMSRGLNNWIGQNYYIQITRPTATTVMNVNKTSIGVNRKPWAADTVEYYPNSYNGHRFSNQKPIGHWIAATAYSSSGATTCFVDPATSVWGSTKAEFCANTTSFTNSYLQSNGIAW